MMKRPIRLIHGHTMDQLQHLLANACPLIEDDIGLDSKAVGGWSNINIHGTSNGREFVLKLPWSTRHYDTNPYSRLYNLLGFLHKSKLTTQPLAIGRFQDRNETPFMLLKYYAGKVHSSISDFSIEELRLLKHALRRLSQQKPLGLRRYKTPLDYLIDLHDTIAHHEYLSVSRKEVLNLSEAFFKQYTNFHSGIESLDVWPGAIMHGDLWEPNILLQEGRVILLDMESCSYGNPLFDLAYLLEASDSPPLKTPPSTLYGGNIKSVNPLRPIALMAVISWSLDRLMFMDAGLVDQNLNTDVIRADIIRYTRVKISRLVSFLS